MRKLALLGLCLSFVPLLAGQDAPSETAEAKQSREALREPVFRIGKARIEPKSSDKVAPKIEFKPAGAGEHPLDPAIKIAKECLQRIRADIADYSCTLVKQERINGTLLPQEYMYTEIRNRKVNDGKVTTPLAVYMYFLKPEKMKGREVIYVEGSNDGKLVAHEANFLKIAGVVELATSSTLAMRGNRYPITEVGIENLIEKLVEKGERDRAHQECTVQFKPGVKINDRQCTLLEVVHPHPRPHFDFHIARVYIDNDLNLPLRYEALTWPTQPGGQPELLECYTYLNLKVNINLDATKFDRARFRL